VAPRYRLKLTSLKFISAVDAGAQGEISNVALLKRHDANGIEATCQVVKIDAALGLVFGWALASSLDGGKTQHVDLQGDAIQNDDLIKVAAEFMESAAASDVMHDDAPDGRIVFAMPLIPEINAALGIQSDVHGLAIAMKPSAETFKRFQSGELKAFSIAGQGERTPLVEKLAPGSISASAIASALAAVSPRSSAPVRKDSTMPTIEELLAENAELKAKLAATEKSEEDMVEIKEELVEAEKRATLTDAQRTYHKSLDKADAKAFLSKSFTERETVLAAIEKANEIVYTSKSTGETFRKSDDARLVTMAKRQDEQAAELAKRDEAIEKADIATLAKSTLGNLGGSEEVHQLIVKSLRKSGAPQVEIDAAMTAISGWHVLAKSAGIAKGVGGSAESTGTPKQALNALVEKFAADNKVPFVKARAAVMETDEGLRLYAESESRK